MNQYYWALEDPVMDSIAHHGILGQKSCLRSNSSITVLPQKRRFLAKRIKERMKVFGIRYDSLTESKENSFYNYTGYD